jgi:hypothetical protein
LREEVESRVPPEVLAAVGPTGETGRDWIDLGVRLAPVIFAFLLAPPAKAIARMISERRAAPTIKPSGMPSRVVRLRTETPDYPSRQMLEAQWYVRGALGVYWLVISAIFLLASFGLLYLTDSVLAIPVFYVLLGLAYVQFWGSIRALKTASLLRGKTEGDPIDTSFATVIVDADFSAIVSELQRTLVDLGAVNVRGSTIELDPPEFAFYEGGAHGWPKRRTGERTSLAAIRRDAASYTVHVASSSFWPRMRRFRNEENVRQVLAQFSAGRIGSPGAASPVAIAHPGAVPSWTPAGRSHREPAAAGLAEITERVKEPTVGHSLRRSFQ